MARQASSLNESIRKHIYRLVASGGTGDRLPTEQALCELFSVSRGTVRTVLKPFVDEGAIIPRKGAGMFIQKIPDLAPGSLLIGIADGNGRKAFFVQYSGLISVGAARCLCQHGHSFDFLDNPSTSHQWGDVLVQIRQSGLLWINADVEGLRVLAANGTPAVALGTCTRDGRQEPVAPLFCNGVLIDEFHEGRLFVKHCAARGGRKLLVISEHGPDSRFILGVHSALEDLDLDPGEHLMLLGLGQAGPPEIGTALAQGHTGVYCDDRRLVMVHKVLKGAGFTHEKNCRLVARQNSLLLRNPEIEYDGIDCHLEEVGRQGALLLLDVIAAPTAEPRHLYVKPTLVPHARR